MLHISLTHPALVPLRLQQEVKTNNKNDPSSESFLAEQTQHQRSLGVQIPNLSEPSRDVHSASAVVRGGGAWCGCSRAAETETNRKQFVVEAGDKRC